jgi:site-specific recombinase XerD
MKHLPIYTLEYKELHSGFENWMAQLGYSDQEVNNNSNRLREFLNYLEKQGIQSTNKISKPVANGYLNYISTRPRYKQFGALSLNYQNKHINTLHQLGKYLRKVKEIDISLQFAYYNYDKIERNSLTINEIKLLYKAATISSYEARDKAILAIFYGCGLRRSEGARLTLRDLLFDKNLVYVRKGKNNKERCVPMGRRVKADLKTYIRTHRREHLQGMAENSDRLFISNFGKPMTGSGIFKNFQRLTCQVTDEKLDKKLCEKQPGLHTLRHSIATHLLDVGMDIEYVGRFLGHSSLTSTQIYTHLKRKK